MNPEAVCTTTCSFLIRPFENSKCQKRRSSTLYHLHTMCSSTGLNDVTCATGTYVMLHLSVSWSCFLRQVTWEDLKSALSSTSHHNRSSHTIQGQRDATKQNTTLQVMGLDSLHRHRTLTNRKMTALVCIRHSPVLYWCRAHAP